MNKTRTIVVLGIVALAVVLPAQARAQTATCPTTNVPAGDDFTVTGTGAGNSESITLKRTNASGLVIGSGQSAATGGTFSITAVFPSSDTGTQTVYVDFATSTDTTCQVTLSSANPTCTVTIPTGGARRGGNIGVSGKGLPPNAAITVVLEDGTVLTGSSRETNDFGRFTEVARTIPTDAPLGTHTVRARAGTVTKDCTPTINIQAAATPSPTASPSPTPTRTPTPTPTGGGSTGLTGPLIVSDTTPERGQTVNVSGGGFDGNAQVTVEFHSILAQLGTQRADLAGVFSTSVTIPANATLGAHTLTATGRNATGTQNRVLTAAITVVAAGSGGAGTGGQGLPKTGSALPIASGLLGSALLAFGSALHGWDKRQRFIDRIRARWQNATPVENVVVEPVWNGSGDGDLFASSRTVAPGEFVSLSGFGFRGDTDVTVTVATPRRIPKVMAFPRTLASGSFVVDVQISRRSLDGTCTITAVGTAPDGSTRTTTTTLVVRSDA